MTRTITEKDWKYLRSIEKELLSNLCRDINQSAVAILSSESGSEHDRYLKLYKHIDTSDRIMADCFNDWRRSNLCLKLLLLHKHNLLAAEHIAKLSDETRKLINRFTEDR